MICDSVSSAHWTCYWSLKMKLQILNSNIDPSMHTKWSDLQKCAYKLFFMCVFFSLSPIFCKFFHSTLPFFGYRVYIIFLKNVFYFLLTWCTWWFFQSLVMKKWIYFEHKLVKFILTVRHKRKRENNCNYFLLPMVNFLKKYIHICLF